MRCYQAIHHCSLAAPPSPCDVVHFNHQVSHQKHSTVTSPVMLSSHSISFQANNTIHIALWHPHIALCVGSSAEPDNEDFHSIILLASTQADHANNCIPCYRDVLKSTYAGHVSNCIPCYCDVL